MDLLRFFVAGLDALTCAPEAKYGVETEVEDLLRFGLVGLVIMLKEKNRKDVKRDLPIDETNDEVRATIREASSSNMILYIP